MEAYKVWATLNLKGDAFKKMEQFSKMTKRADADVNKLMNNTKALSNIFQKMSSSLRILNPELSRFAISFHRMSSNIESSSSAMNKFNANISSSSSRMNTASIRAEKLAASLNSVSVQAGIASKSAGIVRVGKDGREKSGSGRILSRGASSFATGAISGAGIGHIGFGMAGAGLAVGAGLYKAAHAGSNYQKELAMIQLQHIPGLNKKIAENYAQNSNLPGISRLEALSGLAEAASITKSGEEALHIAPFISRMKKSAESLGVEGFSKTQTQAALKVAEIVSGSNDANVLQKHMDMMFQTYLSTSGRVEPTQYLSVTRSAAGAISGMKPESFYYGMEPLIQEFGTRVGPMIDQFFAHMKAGRLTHQGAELLSNMGLVKKGGLNINKKTGNLKGINPGGMIDLDLMGKQMFTWLDKYYFPALEKMTSDVAEQEGITGKIFTNKDRNLVMSYQRQRKKIRLAEEINAGTGGVGESETMIGGLHVGKFNELVKSFDNLFLTLDKFSGPVLDNVAGKFTTLFEKLDSGLGWIFQKVYGSHNTTNGPFGAKIQPDQFNTILDNSGGGNNKPINVTMMLDTGKIAGAVIVKMPDLVKPLTNMGTVLQNNLWNGISPAGNV